MRSAEVAIVVRRGEDYLVLLRAEAGGGYWHLVAGGVEHGETAAVAAARELEEEVGLSVPLARFWSFSYSPTTVEHLARALAPVIAVEVFLAEAPPGWEPELDHEHVEHRWLDAAAAGELLFWPEPREAVLIAAARS